MIRPTTATYAGRTSSNSTVSLYGRTEAQTTRRMVSRPARNFEAGIALVGPVNTPHLVARENER